MDEKLQKLAEKIYSEGVEKAKSEAERIIQEAEEKASKILKEAEKEKEHILKKANQEMEDLYRKTIVELRSAAEQVKLSLKQELIDFISKNALKSDVSETLNDVEFVKNLLTEIVKKWDVSSDIEVILPETKKKDFENIFVKKVKETLGKNVVLTFEGRMQGGFKIQPKDGNFVLSFTDEDMNQFFASYLKQKTKELLFSENK
ncbi:MAG: hypothetical protein N2258_05935 [Brevinematales bacterium]|nr:hypothetical protein [Brevinematales bacterium]